MKYNNNWLAGEFDNNNENVKFLYFWGHQPSKDGSITKACFSQWWIASFEIDGICYQTAEHWMMAAKARLFNDTVALEKILTATTAPEAKKLGREVNNFDAEKWDAEKYALVVKGNLHKFSSNPDLRSFLLNTADRVLVEASPVDNIWGIGLAADDPKAANPHNWKGENLLGYALMEVRELLYNN